MRTAAQPAPWRSGSRWGSSWATPICSPATSWSGSGARASPSSCRLPTRTRRTPKLAIAAAVRRGATSVAILGALGGPRFDHALANVALLADPAGAGIDTSIVDPSARIRLLAAPTAVGGRALLSLAGRVGDTVSLLPFGQDADGVTTAGLLYPLADETLAFGPARGVSNVRVATDASVSLLRGRLLVVESPASVTFTPASPPPASPGGVT